MVPVDGSRLVEDNCKEPKSALILFTRWTGVHAVAWLSALMAAWCVYLVLLGLLCLLVIVILQTPFHFLIREKVLSAIARSRRFYVVVENSRYTSETAYPLYVLSNTPS